MKEEEDKELLAEVFNTNEPKLRICRHLQNLKQYCPQQYAGFVFVLHKFMKVLPAEITNVVTLSDLEQYTFVIKS